MLGKAAEWGVVAAPSRIKLVKEEGRSATIDDGAEAKLLAAAKQPLHDILIIMLDTGMRPGEVFRMCWEDVLWDRKMIFIPKGKTPRSRRYLPISDRALDLLRARHHGAQGF